MREIVFDQVKYLRAMITASVFESSLTEIEGFPRPNWKFLHQWVAANVAKSNLYEAWDSIAQMWLQALRDRLGDSYSIDAEAEFGMLSTLKQHQAAATLRHAVSAKRTMQDYLRALPSPNFLGPHVIIALDTVRDFASYIAPFFSDGEYGRPGGICIRTGYMHMVFPPTRIDALQSGITHELTHVMLAQLNLPSWLEEGIAQTLQSLVGGYSLFHLDHEMAARHRDYWSRNGLQNFWSGRSFYNQDDGCELSYNLSQVLVRNLSTDYPSVFFKFVADAKREDAGDSAIQSHMGLRLGDCAAQFLGKGDWSPDLAKLRQLCPPDGR